MPQPTEALAAVVAWSTEQAGTLVGVPVSALDGLGVVGLVALLGLGFATSRLYTRGQVIDLKETHAREIERMERAHERELEEANHDKREWQAAQRLGEQALIEERAHSQALVHDIAEPVKGLLSSVRQAAIEVRSGVEQ